MDLEGMLNQNIRERGWNSVSFAMTRIYRLFVLFVSLLSLLSSHSLKIIKSQNFQGVVMVRKGVVGR